ncbi:nucleoside diphosphate kinase, partial [Fimicolochytrium jonesii]|uniref:nucleoside diphosphate kinase n=1 Tax=Fimicolochytrium jonesii TaxID=1396493 RepID=UPI0022FEB15B
ADGKLWNSIRALYGTDGSHNAVHGSDSPASAEREIQLIFPHEAGKSSAAQHPSATLSGQPFQRTLALIKPDAYPARKNDILTRIRDAGFTIVGEKDVQFSKEIAESFYAEHVGKTFYADLVKWMSSAPIYALVLEKEGAISGWRELAGPTNSATARENAPNSIRALYGKNGSSNAVHGSDSEESAKREIQIVFGETVSPFATAKGVKAAIPKTKSQGALASVESSVPFPSGQLGQDERHLERTLALIKPDAYGLHRDAILSRVQDDGFVIIKQEEVTFTREKAAEFYKEHLGKPFYDRLVEWMSSAPIYALVLEKEGAIKAWRELAGPTNAETARNTAPNSIRALYGTDGSQNAVHGSDSAASAIREIGIVFGDSVKAGPAYSEKTLALLKPDVSRSAHKDEIIQLINQSGLKIADEKVLTFTADKAKEFYREHEGKPFFDGLVQWMTSAPIYALILEGENAIKRWRELAGPTDSTKAKETAPTSIRGRFGTDGQKNAVHGSDSPASAAREIDIVFAHGDVAPHPPSAAKPAAAPARVAAASTKRSTNNLANGKNMGSQSVLASKSRSPSRTSSNSGLNKAGTKATASSDRLATKPASRVSSTQNLSNARTKSSAALKKSNLGLNTPGGEKDSPPAALELPGHIETHRGEGVDKVPIDGNAGPGIMDDPTNVAVREE